MKKLFIYFLIFISTNSYAISVEQFLKMQKDSNSTDTPTKLVADTALIFYFQGIADLLNGVIDEKSGEVVYAEHRKICLPKTVTFSNEVIRALTVSEIKMIDKSNAFGEDWKKQNINVVVFLTLARNYPCQNT